MAKLEIPIIINLPDDWLEQVVRKLKADGCVTSIMKCKDCANYLERCGSCKSDAIDSTSRIIMPDWYCADWKKKGENYAD